MWGFIFIMFIFFKVLVSHPFILDEFPSRCVFNSNTSFTSELLQTENEELVIYYTFCGYVPKSINCGINVTACLKNKRDNSISVMGRGEFILDNDQNLYLNKTTSNICKSNPVGKYNLAIKFDNVGEEQYLEKKNGCDYVIHRLSPNYEPACTKRVPGLLIDLRPLKENIFWVNSEIKNFSLTLCRPNNYCDKTNLGGISTCEVINNDTIPLSNTDKEMVLYNVDKNELSIHGSYKGNRKQDNKQLEIILKCDWSENPGKITYKKIPIQGKHYKFEMETIFGCLKLPPQCVITDKFFIYNLTDLYNSRGYIEVSNVPSGKIYLNFCGPLKLDEPKNNCSNEFSQVCEVRNGVYINKGSISSKLQIFDDVIKVTFTSGAKCQKDTKYSTNINFICSEKEQGPMFIKSYECETFIDWLTPQACPTYGTDNCKNNNPVYHYCELNDQGYHYDLSELTLTNGSYRIEDTTNKSIQYILNVCGPALDIDAPCMRDSSILMKDLHQYNLQYKVKSLGKMYQMDVSNGEVVIENLSGSYCGQEGDYKSYINFLCSHKQEQPQLTKKTECSFYFQWKTPHACPITGNNCLFLGDNFLLDFSKINKDKRLVNINITNKDNKTYKLDFCQNNYTECSSSQGQNSAEKCIYPPVEKTLIKHGNRNYLEFDLQKECDSETNFNRVSFELMCNRVINNEHFNFTSVIKNCTIMMQFFTNVVCTDDDSELENTKYETINEHVESIEPKNCSVNNPLTGYNFYISNLQIHIPYLDCPKVIFNKHSSSVMLLYSNDTDCQELNGYGKHVYKILLRCSDKLVNKSDTSTCTSSYNFDGPEFCKLFETLVLENRSETNYSSSAGIIIGSVLGGLALIGICTYLYFKTRKRVSRTFYQNIYEKDADL